MVCPTFDLIFQAHKKSSATRDIGCGLATKMVGVMPFLKWKAGVIEMLRGRYPRPDAFIVAAFLILVGAVIANAAEACGAPGASADADIASCTRAITDGNKTKFASPGFQVKVYVARGDAYFRKSDFDRAIEDYNEATRVNPKFVVPYYKRGYIYYLKGDKDRAIQEFDQAIQGNQNYAAAFAYRGSSYLDKGDNDRAIQDFNRAIEIDPKYALAFNRRGNAYLNKKDFEHAIADQEQVIRLSPASDGGYVDRGSAYSWRGDIDKAIADFDQAIRLNPKNAVSFEDRGLARRRKGNIDGAIADYTEAIRLDPAYLAAYTNRGQAREAKGDRDAARFDYAAAAGMPIKYPSGKTAQETARTRLAILSSPTLPPAKQQKPAAVPIPASIPAPTTTPVRRLALVLGNSAYQQKALTNPANDARAMATMLRQIGFQVVDGYDLDYTSMRRIISNFIVQAASAQLVVVYYAGHGVQAQGSNYLVPIDAKLESQRTANFEMFDVDQIISPLNDPARTTIIILDACRNNPFATQTASTRGLDVGSGLAGYSGVSPGMLIAFATSPGKVAEDGAGAHSPFTEALLQYIATPKLEVLGMFRKVRKAVMDATNRKQIPWDENSLIGDVYMVEAGH
jgi:tetratricopeptide (TPR) repeat protein